MHEKTLYILYRDSSFRISISKRFRIKDLNYLVHFLWLKYSTSPPKMIVYSLYELLRFLYDSDAVFEECGKVSEILQIVGWDMHRCIFWAAAQDEVVMNIL